jgi:hypothetical protein
MVGQRGCFSVLARYQAFLGGVGAISANGVCKPTWSRIQKSDQCLFSSAYSSVSRPCLWGVVWEGCGCTVLCVLQHLHSAKSIRGRDKFSILFVFLPLRLFAFPLFRLFVSSSLRLFVFLPFCFSPLRLFLKISQNAFGANKKDKQ